jgi:tape measure domain-containing protein
MSEATNRLKESMNKVVDSVRKTARESEKADKSTKKTTSSFSHLDRESKRVANNTRQMQDHLRNSQAWAKDLKRIVAGIVVSQAFYQLLGVMQDLVRQSVQFANNMDQAQIAFKYLLEDANDATAMINSLQDFAIHSPLDTSQVMDSTRKLMAMGFEAKSVIPTLEVMADTAAVFSGKASEMSDMISHITLAIGQMRASGKVMTQELRQLYNAGIPVFTILQEQLGLTAEQVRHIGKLGIDSGTAVVALLKGLQERYAGAAEEFTKTIPGALEVIEDSVYVLYTMLSKEPHNALKKWLNDIANLIEALVVLARNYGPGAIIDVMFGPRTAYAIRALMGSLIQLGRAFSAVGDIIKDLFSGALALLAQMLGFVLPPLTILVNLIAQIVRGVYVTIPFIRELAIAFTALLIVGTVVKVFTALWRVMRMAIILEWVKGAVINLVKALYSLVKAVTLATITNWKFVASLVAILAILALILTASSRVRESMTKFVNAFKNIGIGFDPSDIAAPKFEPPPVGDFEGGGLKDIITDVEDLGDEADKTGKKLKNMFNQSFDEVFTIDDSAGGPLGDIAGTDFSTVLAGLDELLAKTEKLAMTGDFWKDWDNIQDHFGIGDIDFMDDVPKLGNDFWNAVEEAFSAPEWIGAGLGAIIGGVIGGLIGGVPGTIIGAAIGGAAGWLAGLYWEDITKALERAGIGSKGALGMSIGGPLGAGIGLIIGGPAGAAIGLAIGTLIGWLTGEIVEGFQTGDWAGVAMPLGMGIGAAVGLVVGGPGGALIGAALGGLIGWVVEEFQRQSAEGNWAKAVAPIGMGLGAGIGFFVGGPIGAMLGGAIGMVVGWIVGKFIEADWSGVKDAFFQPWRDFKEVLGIFFLDLIWDPIKEAWDNADWLSLGLNIIVGLISGLLGAIPLIGVAIMTLFKSVWKAITSIFGIEPPATTMIPIGINIVLGVIEGIVATIQEVLMAIAELGRKIIKAFKDILKNLGEGIKEGLKVIYDTFINWINDLWNNVFNKLFGWIKEGLTKIKEFFTESDKANKAASSSPALTSSGPSTRSVMFSLPDTPDVPVVMSTPMSGLPIDGHRDGGIFNKEHVAWISEGDDPEAIIPLNNPGAMQPFVDAVSSGVAAALLPVVASMEGRQNQMQPLYVGTLVADERGLKELERKMEIIRIAETQRRG